MKCSDCDTPAVAKGFCRRCYQRNRRATDPDWRERVNAQNRRYRAALSLDDRRRIRERNRVREAERASEDPAWWERFVDRRRKRGHITYYRAGIVAELIQDRGRACGVCDEPIDKGNCHVDHIISLHMGGTNDLDNLQLTHPQCNQTKGR